MLTFIQEMEAGLVRVNAETAGVELQAPFGGMKGSSSHSREQGQAAIEFYTADQNRIREGLIGRKRAMNDSVPEHHGDRKTTRTIDMQTHAPGTGRHRCR